MGEAARGHLAPGARGDLALVDTDGGGFDVVATVVGGRVLHDRRSASLGAR